MFSLQQNWRTRGLLGSAQKQGGGEREGVVGRKGEVAQTMYTHISKCKNNK
jgi:hypothetical protein